MGRASPPASPDPLPHECAPPRPRPCRPRWSPRRAYHTTLGGHPHARRARLGDQNSAAGLPHRLGAAHLAAGAVARRAERVMHRPLGTDQHERVAAHVSGHQHRLTDRAAGGGHGGVTGRDRARRPLAMDQAAHPAARGFVRLELGDVVCHVIDEREADRLGVALEHRLERAAHLVGDELAVCPRVVGRSAHRPQVGPGLGVLSGAQASWRSGSVMPQPESLRET